MNELLKFLGDDNAKKIKEAITDLVIENIKEMIETEYIFSVESIQDDITKMIADVVESEKDTIEFTVKKKLSNTLNELLKNGVETE